MTGAGMPLRSEPLVLPMLLERDMWFWSEPMLFMLSCWRGTMPKGWFMPS